MESSKIKMPEFHTVKGFKENLERYIRDFDDPAGPTMVVWAWSPDRELKGGGLFKKDPLSKDALRRIKLLVRDSDASPRELEARAIHSLQQDGTNLEILLARDDFSPENQTVDALRFSFKTCGQIGVIRDIDLSSYPSGYHPDSLTMEHGRSRGALFLGLKNTRMDESEVTYIIELADGWPRPNWTACNVIPRAATLEEGGLGSGPWLLSNYGLAYDPLKSSDKWIEGFIDEVLGRNEQKLLGGAFVGRYADFEAQGELTLLHMLSSNRFKGDGALTKSEELTIFWFQDKRLKWVFTIKELRKEENIELIPLVGACHIQFLKDAGFQDKHYDIQKANIGKKAAFQCNFVLSYLQKGQVLVGKPTRNKDGTIPDTLADNNKKNCHLKAYVHPAAHRGDPAWTRIQEDLDLREFADPLAAHGLSRGGLGMGIHGFVLDSEVVFYANSSEPQDRQTKRVGGGKFCGDPVAARANPPVWSRNPGKNERRLRDVFEGLYPLRGFAREVYEHGCKYAGVPAHMVRSGKSPRTQAPPKPKQPPPWRGPPPRSSYPIAPPLPSNPPPLPPPPLPPPPLPPGRPLLWSPSLPPGPPPGLPQSSAALWSPPLPPGPPPGLQWERPPPPLPYGSSPFVRGQPLVSPPPLPLWPPPMANAPSPARAALLPQRGSLPPPLPSPSPALRLDGPPRTPLLLAHALSSAPPTCAAPSRPPTRAPPPRPSQAPASAPPTRVAPTRVAPTLAVPPRPSLAPASAPPTRAAPTRVAPTHAASPRPSLAPASAPPARAAPPLPSLALASAPPRPSQARRSLVLPGRPLSPRPQSSHDRGDSSDDDIPLACLRSSKRLKSNAAPGAPDVGADMGAVVPPLAAAVGRKRRSGASNQGGTNQPTTTEADIMVTEDEDEDEPPRRRTKGELSMDRFLRCYKRNLKKSGGVAGVEAGTECLEEAMPNATATPAPSLSSQPSSGVELVGKRVRVWWQLDQKYHAGRVKRFTKVNNQHEVLYDDGTREAVNMYQKRWELEESDAESEDEPSPGGDDSSAQVEVPQIELPQYLYLPMPPSMRGHCTSERFERAQAQLIELMVETTSPTNRLERGALRAAARHLVKDTGVLDFLLAHMAGSLVQAGGQFYRFCRKRNEAGRVECWLEEEEAEAEEEYEDDAEEG